MNETKNDTRPDQPSPAVFDALKEEYAVRSGDCFNVAKALQGVYGDEIALITRDGHPFHAFVRLPNGEHCDGAGMACPDEIREHFEDADACSIRPAYDGDLDTMLKRSFVDEIRGLIKRHDPQIP